jgi:pimeloyl-ACP methyl ester carboxylesterase
MDTGFHVVQTELLEIAYEERGPREGLPVILLHGWPDDVRTWDGVVAPLNMAGFRTIAPYLRGFGPTRFLAESTVRSGQLAALGNDVVELAGALRLARFALVGHDWGARAAYIAAAELGPRVSHLVVLSVGHGTNDPGQQLPLVQVRNYWYHWYFALPRGADLVKGSRRELGKFLWATWSPGWRFADADYAETAASFDNPDWADVTLHSYRHRWGHAPGDPRYDALERRLSSVPTIRVPTLVLHGDADACNNPLTSADKEQFFADRYERKLLPGVGHFPQREAPDTVAREVIAWLRQEGL